jgi:alginate O-acetyltransferase complex protein AlgI
MLTMLLGGLWHGAAWTFIVWGGLHGLYLMVERFLKEKVGPTRFSASTIGKVILGLLTYFLVNVTWVFFRAPDFDAAWRMITSMFGFATDPAVELPTIYIIQVVGAISTMVGVHWFMRERTLEAVVSRLHWIYVALILAAMAFAIIITQPSGSAFIYFQF